MSIGPCQQISTTDAHILPYLERWDASSAHEPADVLRVEAYKCARLSRVQKPLRVSRADLPE